MIIPRDYKKEYHRMYDFDKDLLLRKITVEETIDRYMALSNKKPQEINIEVYQGEVRVTAREGITTGELKILKEKYPNRKGIKLNV